MNQGDEPTVRDALPEDVARLVRDAATLDAISDDTRARVGAQLWKRIDALPPRSKGETSMGGAARSAARTSSAVAARSITALGIFALGFVGGGLFVGAMRSSRDPIPRVPTPNAPSVSPAPTSARAPRTAPTPEPPRAAATLDEHRVVGGPTKQARDRTASSAPEVSSTLDRERQLVEAARADLAAGDAHHALGLIAQHGRAFPHGVLAEEREALAVRALVATNAFAEARERAAAFETQFPGSMQRRAVLDALDRIPSSE